MKRLLGLSACVLFLAGCQTTGENHTAPLCSGKQRRPMNIYPSVLPNLENPASAGLTAPTVTVSESQQAGGAALAHGPATPDSTVYPSCE